MHNCICIMGPKGERGGALSPVFDNVLVFIMWHILRTTIRNILPRKDFFQGGSR